MTVFERRSRTLSDRTISDLGELAAIERIKAFGPEGVVGDDAAVVSLREGHRLVITTDMLTEGVHFSDRTTPPYSIGWRATAANLSDLAAMGAEATGITIALGLPPQTPFAWIEELYRGIAACLSAYGGIILGGDLCRADQQTISITALGDVRPAHVIARDGAVAGMTVVVSGPHGGSRAGLAVLLGENTVEAVDCNRPEVKDWIRAHQLPVPRFDVVAQLHDWAGDHTPYPKIAGMDSSDGLANALLQLSKSSGVGMNIVRSHIPLPLNLCEAVGEQTALNWALYGGEDFELVLCLPPDLASQMVECGLVTAIGTTTKSNAQSGVVKLFDTEACAEGRPVYHQSYQHF